MMDVQEVSKEPASQASTSTEASTSAPTNNVAKNINENKSIADNSCPPSEGALEEEEEEDVIDNSDGGCDEGDFVDRDEISDFLYRLDQYSPAIPDAVTNYYLRVSGFNCPDEKV